ncbi:MAG: hypothetical protein AAFO75_06485, partial [Pseudomonadota bacterium]
MATAFTAALLTALTTTWFASQSAYADWSELYDAETGYRIKHYRSAVPPDVPGGTTVDINGVDDLLKNQKAILL